MPDNFDINNTAYMLEALEEIKEAKTFLLRTFYPNSVNFMKSKVTIDIVKGERLISPYVLPREEGPVVEREGFYTNEYEVPALKPKIPIDMVDLEKRYPGEVPIGGFNSENPNHQVKYAEMRGKDLNLLNSMNERALELQASQGLFDGVIEILDLEGKKVLADIDFQRNSENVIDCDGSTGKEGWDQSDSQPDVQLLTWKAIALKNSGILPNVGVLGDEARKALLTNDKAKSALDNRRYNPGRIEIIEQESGVQYIGILSGVELWNYSEWYKHPVTGTLTALVPTQKLLLGNRETANKILYGLINHTDMQNFPEPPEKYPFIYKENDPSREFLQLLTSPLAACNQVDAFVVVDVIEGS